MEEYIRSLGVSDVGFCKVDDYPGMKTAISLVIRLSDAVVDEITDKPTFSYFHHYRTVNFFIDQCQLSIGMELQKRGYRYMPVGASQSIPVISQYSGLYSHKKAAVLSGLGTVGKNDLFLHKDFGPRVRLGTILTDAPIEELTKTVVHVLPSNEKCKTCTACVNACPAKAINDACFDSKNPDRKLVDAEKCSKYMKNNFQKIGRGSVCGVCMKVCPMAK